MKLFEYNHCMYSVSQLNWQLLNQFYIYDEMWCGSTFAISQFYLLAKYLMNHQMDSVKVSGNNIYIYLYSESMFGATLIQ